MPPDYLGSIPAAEQEQFLDNYETWKATKKPKLKDEKKVHLPNRHLNDEERRRLAKMVEDDVNDKNEQEIDTTFGDKAYFTFDRLARECPEMARQFIEIGEELLERTNQQLPEGNKMLLLKRQCLVLLTYGPRTTRNFDFRIVRKGVPKLKGQLPHIDAPSVVLDLPSGVEAFLSAFFTMTKRSATRMYFDMSLDELLDGKTWGDDAETNEWILRQLMFAHMFAFEIQASKNDEAVKNGQWEASPPGSVEFFRPGSRWHSGNEGLMESELPEVVLLFEFAWEPIAAFYDTHFYAEGGFGQHPWNAKTASYQLGKVRKHTHSLSQATAPAPPAKASGGQGTLKYEGAGVTSITLEMGWAYLIRSNVTAAPFVHKTGPNASIGGKVERLVIIISGHFPGDPTVSEHDLLRKESYLSHLYHYRYLKQGVVRGALPREKEIVYIQKEEQVPAEDLIDTKSTELPDIPHGPLEEKLFSRLKRAAGGVHHAGKLILFSKYDTGMEHETPANKANLKEAYENIKNNLPRLVKSEIVECNDYQRMDPKNPESPTIREAWTQVARGMGRDLGVPDAQRFQVFAVRLVDQAALSFHLDQLGLGPSVYVGVLKTEDAYKVLLAKVKQGPRYFLIVCPDVFFIVCLMCACR